MNNTSTWALDGLAKAKAVASTTESRLEPVTGAMILTIDMICFSGTKLMHYGEGGCYLIDPGQQGQRRAKKTNDQMGFVSASPKPLRQREPRYRDCHRNGVNGHIGYCRGWH